MKKMMSLLSREGALCGVKMHGYTKILVHKMIESLLKDIYKNPPKGHGPKNKPHPWSVKVATFQWMKAARDNSSMVWDDPKYCDLVTEAVLFEAERCELTYQEIAKLFYNCYCPEYIATLARKHKITRHHNPRCKVSHCDLVA